MRTFTIKIGGRTYTTSRISTYVTRQLFAINKASVSVADEYKNIQTADTDEAIEMALKLFGDIESIFDKKSALICEAYGNKFTVDELEKALTREEIDKQIQELTLGVLGIATKN